MNKHDKKHWKEFKEFEGSDLHSYFIDKIKIKESESIINSSYFGKEVLVELMKLNLELYNKYKSKNMGVLFGTTIYEYLIKPAKNWIYKRIKRKDKNKYFSVYIKDE